nr:MAG TPA: REPLICASE POLYPROTEIN 1AB, HCOV, MEMBRANE, HELICASE, SARS [Caudoviricetes sp.]
MTPINKVAPVTILLPGFMYAITSDDDMNA